VVLKKTSLLLINAQFVCNQHPCPLHKKAQRIVSTAAAAFECAQITTIAREPFQLLGGVEKHHFGFV
jgi:hypothetical protein